MEVFPILSDKKMINLGERNVTECAKMHRYQTVFLSFCVCVCCVQLFDCNLEEKKKKKALF